MNTQTKRLLLTFPILFWSFGISANAFKNKISSPNPTFIVYYESDSEPIIQDSCGYFRSFLDAYHLEIVNTFEINKSNKGITLVVKQGTVDSYNLAKELSMIKGITMVEICTQGGKKVSMI